MQNSGFVLINLQPYREKVKREKIRQAAMLMGFFVFIGAMFVFTVDSAIEGRVSSQKGRNDFISKKNVELDAQIKDIANLKENIRDTLAKRQVVESLQVNRSDGVIILNELASRLPDGTLLKQIKREGAKITIIGQTQSQSKVSSYMTALKDSTLLGEPTLIEIKAVDVITPRVGKKDDKGDVVRFNEFKVVVPVKVMTVDSLEEEAPASSKTKKEAEDKTKNKSKGKE